MTKQRCAGMSANTATGKPSPCQRFAKPGGFCHWHDPDRALKVKKKPEGKALLAVAQRVLLGEDCIAAVKRIAAGHSDPMALCQNVLNRFKSGAAND